MEKCPYVARAELDLGLPHIKESPKQKGSLKLIVARPGENARKVMDAATLDLKMGLVGDNWYERGSRRSPDGKGFIEQQITIMNVRSAALIITNRDKWALAGDQLYVDFDLSIAFLPPGSRIKIGACLLEINALPHTGCKKFAHRFGQDALQFVNSREGRALNLRGVNATLIEGGQIRVGDVVERIGT